MDENGFSEHKQMFYSALKDLTSGMRVLFNKYYSFLFEKDKSSGEVNFLRESETVYTAISYLKKVMKWFLRNNEKEDYKFVQNALQVSGVQVLLQKSLILVESNASSPEQRTILDFLFQVFFAFNYFFLVSKDTLVVTRTELNERVAKLRKLNLRQTHFADHCTFTNFLFSRVLCYSYKDAGSLVLAQLFFALVVAGLANPHAYVVYFGALLGNERQVRETKTKVSMKKKLRRIAPTITDTELHCWFPGLVSALVRLLQTYLVESRRAQQFLETAVRVDDWCADALATRLNRLARKTLVLHNLSLFLCFLAQSSPRNTLVLLAENSSLLPAIAALAFSDGSAFMLKNRSLFLKTRINLVSFLLCASEGVVATDSLLSCFSRPNIQTLFVRCVHTTLFADSVRNSDLLSEHKGLLLDLVAKLLVLAKRESAKRPPSFVAPLLRCVEEALTTVVVQTYSRKPYQEKIHCNVLLAILVEHVSVSRHLLVNKLFEDLLSSLFAHEPVPNDVGAGADEDSQKLLATIELTNFFNELYNCVTLLRTSPVCFTTFATRLAALSKQVTLSPFDTDCSFSEGGENWVFLETFKTKLQKVFEAELGLKSLFALLENLAELFSTFRNGPRDKLVLLFFNEVGLFELLVDVLRTCSNCCYVERQRACHAFYPLDSPLSYKKNKYLSFVRGAATQTLVAFADLLVHNPNLHDRIARLNLVEFVWESLLLNLDSCTVFLGLMKVLANLTLGVVEDSDAFCSEENSADSADAEITNTLKRLVAAQPKQFNKYVETLFLSLQKETHLKTVDTK